MKDFFNTLARKAGKAFTIAALAISLPFTAAASDNSSDRLFPSFPASFSEAQCIPDTTEYRFAVLKNEGMETVGMHPFISIPSDGTFIMDVVYSQEKGYGYILENKGKGQLCVNEVITDLKTHDDLNLKNISHSSALKPEDCTFEPPVLNICGTFENVSSRIINGGYSQDWQATRQDGNVITLLSGMGQSWLLTTNSGTGATIVTGAGKGEFTTPEAAETKPPLLAKK